MPGFTTESRLADALGNPAARAVLERHLPGLVNSPLFTQLNQLPLAQVVAYGGKFLDASAREKLWHELGAIEANVPVRVRETAPVVPRADYEAEDVARGSATVRSPDSAERWGVLELLLDGPRHGNPFVDVELTARFSAQGQDIRVGGFYDGDGRHVIRFMPPETGGWSFTTESNARSLDGVTGRFTVSEAGQGNHGPVRVADTFHFAHADGTRHHPLGTTAYAWTHQPPPLQEQTLDTLRGAPFTKLRMCLFPKAYLFNTNEPSVYPFPRAADGEFDTTRFDPDYWRLLDRRVRELGDIGVEADLILFHAYDRWGFSDLGQVADDRYVRYAVRRLSAYRNVWWSMANEYDLVRSKEIDDWERLAAIVTEEDPVGHLLSIHNCFGFYDYSRPWITHCSIQRVDVYRTAENTDDWRTRWEKPVVIDECAYEGDIDQGWGNIGGEEFVRRCWEGAVRGGYVGHGETYLNDREELWWSKGGELVGDSPARVAFLLSVIRDSPTGTLDPLPSDWDVPWGGVADQYLLAYFGFGRPRYRDVIRPPGIHYTVDVIDTWNMTVERLPGTVEGSFRIPLPGRPYMALRLVAV